MSVLGYTASNMNISKRIYIPLALAAGFTVGILAFWGVSTWMMQGSIKAPPQQPLTVQQPANIPPLQEATTTAPTTPVTEEPTSTQELVASFAHVLESSYVALDVTWLQKPVKLTAAEAKAVVLTFATDTSMFDRAVDNSKNALDGYGPQDYFDSMWKMGAVTSPDYPGGVVYLLNTNEPVPGGVFKDVIVVSPQMKSAWYLPKISPVMDQRSPFVLEYTIPAPNMTVNGMNIPSSITLDTGRTIIRDTTTPGMFNAASYFRFEMTAEEVASFKVATTAQSMTLYTRLNAAYGDLGCIQIILPDGQIIRYGSRIPGVANADGTIQPDVTWDPAYQNTKRYNDRAVGGCGLSGCMNVVSDKDVGDVSYAGKTPDGDPVYVPAKPLTSTLIKSLYDGWYVPEGTKPPIETFVKTHPTAVVFWKDALGRWVELMDSDILPMAECGKPVIYLYPTQTERVSVALPSFINVTKSEPTYPAKGWVVTAHPDGSLEYADGNTYGSLYWEGTGVGYQTPKDGFILKDGTVDQRLSEILAKYGLNQKESQEFRDFWVPKMTGAPYYRLSFLTSDWSQAAPLWVFPRPQTSIRIFMDWQKLDAPISIPEPKIVTPTREGFTLVEWGGLLR